MIFDQATSQDQVVMMLVTMVTVVYPNRHTGFLMWNSLCFLIHFFEIGSHCVAPVWAARTLSPYLAWFWIYRT